MIALCSKCYYVDEQDNKKKKFSTKGMSKCQNFITWPRFKAALKGCTDQAENRGFRMRIEEQKLGLSTYMYYDKCCLLPDRVHTEPIEFHII